MGWNHQAGVSLGYLFVFGHLGFRKIYKLNLLSTCFCDSVCILHDWFGLRCVVPLAFVSRSGTVEMGGIITAGFTVFLPPWAKEPKKIISNWFWGWIFCSPLPFSKCFFQVVKPERNHRNLCVVNKPKISCQQTSGDVGRFCLDLGNSVKSRWLSPSFYRHTSQKINTEPENTPMERENHRLQTIIFRFQLLIFGGVRACFWKAMNFPMFLFSSFSHNHEFVVNGKTMSKVSTVGDTPIFPFFTSMIMGGREIEEDFSAHKGSHCTIEHEPIFSGELPFNWRWSFIFHWNWSWQQHILFYALFSRHSHGGLTFGSKNLHFGVDLVLFGSLGVWNHWVDSLSRPIPYMLHGTGM